MSLVLLASMQALGGDKTNFERLGESRVELKTTLLEVKGDDTNYLISHASQYDLVNLTTEPVSENIIYARKVHVALPYLEGELDDTLWRDWVLPHRVLEEDVSLWRKGKRGKRDPR